MQLIPLLHLHHKKLQIPDQHLLQTLDKDRLLYLYDHDGIENNKPNLNLYKTLSSRYTTWIDNGPRSVGDIVDTVMTGSQHITLRKRLWPTFTLYSIKEITDNALYLYYNPANQNPDAHDTSLPYLGDGILLFNNQQNQLKEFSNAGKVKKLLSKYPTYIYEPNPRNKTYWEQQGIKGLLIELTHYKEY